jgi:hypothetical protein
MQKVAKIKAEIQALTARQRRALTKWLLDQEQEAWDRQMDDDAASGRLDFLIAEAEREEKAGRLRKFP